MDSYIRFLKGMLLAIGLIYWSGIPDIEGHGERVSLVTFILVLGAVPRLLAVIGHGVPTIGIVIGRVLDLKLSSRTAALAYWQGQYVAIDQNEDAVRLAEVSLPASRSRRES
jgi:hypothetical protein